MGRCETCLLWKNIEYDGYIRKGYKSCSFKFDFNNDRTDGIYCDAETIYLYDDHIEPDCYIFTGPKFGCLHHITKKAD